MKPDGKEYEKEVAVPHVWEAIPVEGEEFPQTFLVQKDVSKYIRKLESERNVWKPIAKVPKGGKPERMVLVRRASDEILMGRCIGEHWIVYFNDYKGAQSTEKCMELKYDPVVEWQELPLTPQQIELNAQFK